MANIDRVFVCILVILSVVWFTITDCEIQLLRERVKTLEIRGGG